MLLEEGCCETSPSWSSPQASTGSMQGSPNNGFNRTTKNDPNSSTHGRPSKRTESSETRGTSEKSLWQHLRNCEQCANFTKVSRFLCIGTMWLGYMLSFYGQNVHFFQNIFLFEMLFWPWPVFYSQIAPDQGVTSSLINRRAIHLRECPDLPG